MAATPLVTDQMATVVAAAAQAWRVQTARTGLAVTVETGLLLLFQAFQLRMRAVVEVEQLQVLGVLAVRAVAALELERPLLWREPQILAVGVVAGAIA